MLMHLAFSYDRVNYTIIPMKKLIVFCLSLIILCPVMAQKKQKKPGIGVASSLDNAALTKAAGYDCLVENIQKIVAPKNVSDKQFEDHKKILKGLAVPIYAMNIFIPGNHMVVGPDVNEDSVLAYTEQVFKRTQAAGIKMIVWGSGGSRRIPEGFDRVKAKEQFISIARKIATQAKLYDIVLALENLNSGETNFITTLDEAISIAKKVSHPNFRVCVDIYHMLKEEEPASVILEGKDYLVHCDIAEKEGRTPPGVSEYDFKPFLSALKAINYKGKIIIEAQWEDFEKQAAPAHAYLEKQLEEVYLE